MCKKTRKLQCEASQPNNEDKGTVFQSESAMDKLVEIHLNDCFFILHIHQESTMLAASEEYYLIFISQYNFAAIYLSIYLTNC